VVLNYGLQTFSTINVKKTQFKGRLHERRLNLSDT